MSFSEKHHLGSCWVLADFLRGSRTSNSAKWVKAWNSNSQITQLSLPGCCLLNVHFWSRRLLSEKDGPYVLWIHELIFSPGENTWLSPTPISSGSRVGDSGNKGKRKIMTTVEQGPGMFSSRTIGGLVALHPRVLPCIVARTLPLSKISHTVRNFPALIEHLAFVRWYLRNRKTNTKDKESKQTERKFKLGKFSHFSFSKTAISWRTLSLTLSSLVTSRAGIGLPLYGCPGAL